MASHGVPRSASTVNKSEETRQKELQRIQEYKDLVAEVYQKVEGTRTRTRQRGHVLTRSQKQEKDYSEEALATISQLLTKNPEYYTIWNNRRQILLFLLSRADASGGSDQVRQLLQTDLDFLIPLLRQFPKCYWIWNHRLWLLEQATQRLPLSDARSLWQQELALVGKMLSLDSRNFHGWGYRREVVTALESLAPEPTEPGDRQSGSMAEAELEYTAKMIGTNLSNFSAWHNRSRVILKLLNEQSASDAEREKMLNDELKLIHRALIDPYDQSLWFYHQNLMCTFDPARAAETMAPNLSNSKRAEYLRGEMEAIEEILEEEADCKWIYQALIECTMLHLKLEEGASFTDAKENVARWISELKRLDPLRRGRWEDLQCSFAA